MEKPRVVLIKKIKMETNIVKTIFFKDDKPALPGQFIMVWLPGIDEIPMSLSYIGELKGFAVHKKGEATEKLHELKKNEKIGIRGPYGRGFMPRGKKILFVGGGTGIAPLSPLIERFKGKKKVIIGAKTKDEILYKKRISKYADFIISTDDGSEGVKGTAYDLAFSIMSKENSEETIVSSSLKGRNLLDFDEIIACGPELMLKKLFLFAKEKRIMFQASLERFMKCGIGICDSCAIDGYHVCTDGPVFFEKELSKMEEFGNLRRGMSGAYEKVGNN
ncbi:MAG: dihydroorotate dehydrogenase electron transfer subunit [Candidatus Thermoplasmatota archaeon]